MAAIKRRARELVRRLRRQREPAMTDNVSFNRYFWDKYAADWDDPSVRREGADIRSEGPVDTKGFRVVGEEWGLPEEVAEVVAEYIHPYVGPDSIVGEIGAGGGRVALLVADGVGELHCLDVAPSMLERAREALGDRDNVHYAVVDGTTLPLADASFDFLYSFDVFVHLDLHTQRKYMEEIERALKPGGRAFLHTSNLTTDEGWKLFSEQEGYHVTGFYFVTPEMVETLAGRADLEIVKRSTSGSENYYLDRDFLFILEKKGASA